MTVRLIMPFCFDCAPGEERRVDVVAHAPLPAPMAQRFNLDRLVALGDQGTLSALDAWVITALRVTGGQRVGNVLLGCGGYVPAAVFACAAVGTELCAPFGPGDTLTCAARNIGSVRSKLSLTGVVRPSDWLFFCLACGASVWMANPRGVLDDRWCDLCGAALYHYEPRDRDAGPWRVA